MTKIINDQLGGTSKNGVLTHTFVACSWLVEALFSERPFIERGL